LKIAIQGQAPDVEVIRELLSPWKISFSTLDEAEIVIVHGEKPLETKKTIVIPSDSANFMKWLKDVKVKVVRKLGESVFVAAGEQTVLTITPQTLYFYDGLAKSASRDTAHTMAELDENLILLTVDIVNEYNKILDETLNANPSTIYRLLTGLPVPYTLAPKRLRNFYMRRREGHENLTFCDKLPLDALRFVLVTAIEDLLDKRLRRKTWNGKRYACIVTHDIESRKGLQKAKHVKKLEEKYNVPSAWYIPSKRYKLDLETIKELANYGEIGAHDTKHDGKLAQLPKQRLIKRLHEAKQTLEKIINRSVDGFRAPLLQQRLKIIQALCKTEYVYDTSIPTWEPKHPETMRRHGIGTMHPMNIDGIVEIPVTLPQDHQMIHALGMSPRQTVEAWVKLMKESEGMGGLCVFLTHPDYELARSENLNMYEDLLNAVTGNSEACITLPKEAVSNVLN
jgi:peptidoglycan/xylan/chitin deacetylase (PgdA/CDA1 family)